PVFQNNLIIKISQHLAKRLGFASATLDSVTSFSYVKLLYPCFFFLFFFFFLPIILYF
ncbi:unnamed protein product, partial [Arabidopsis halleri]